MKLIHAAALGLTLFAAPALAQAPAAPAANPAFAVPAQSPIRSGEVAPDGRVTFRLRAPQASSVVVIGDWPGGIDNVTRTPMTRDENGLWSVTVGPLKPEFWTYSIEVDGVAGVDPNNVRERRNGSRYTSTFIVPGDLSADYAVKDVPHGTLSMVWYPSPSMHMNRRAYVYTPPGYEAGRDRYPVLYLLHGGGGDEDAWNANGRASQILDNLIAAGQAKPMIVVMTNGNYNQTASQDYTGTPTPPPGGAGTRVLDFPRSIVPDLLPFVDRTYRTRADANDRAIAGLSMGGAQTFYAAFNNLDKFGWVAAFSGGFPLLPGVAVPIPPPANAAQLKGPDLTNTIDAAKFTALMPQLNASANARLKLLYVSIGTADTLTTTHAVVKDILKAKGVTYTLREFPGYIHEWPVWRVSLRDLLPRLFQPAAK